MDTVVYTIGHSTRSLDEFISILLAYGIKEVVDVRTVSRSRYNAQFNKEVLQRSLQQQDIVYMHMAGLGGWRHTSKGSINTAWKNASFRGYADYMQTPEFEENLEQLISIAREKQIVIMCAEAVPWRCHRSLIGDALLVHNLHVEDIMGESSSKPHRLTPWAQVEGGRITYPR